LSEKLRKFVAEAPYERGPILEFVRWVAAVLPPGTSLADIGAGDAPYRELFEHLDYVTVDWSQSVHEGARQSDILASAESIPVADCSFQSVLMTQVLEHVPEPEQTLREAFRILRPAGSIHLSVPLVWELHEMPYDYYRYTPASLEHLLGIAGFADIEIAPRNDCFTTLAQLMRNTRWTMGRAADGLDPQREAAGQTLEEMAEVVAALAPLDVARLLPLGFTASARRPATPSSEGE
jgi:SAM-dependent methyltransferase